MFFDGLGERGFGFGLAKGEKEGFNGGVVERIDQTTACDGLMHGKGCPEIKGDGVVFVDEFGVEDEGAGDVEFGAGAEGFHRSRGVNAADVEILAEEASDAREGPVIVGERVRGQGVAEELKGAGRHEAQIALGVGKGARDGNEFDVKKAARRPFGAAHPALTGVRVASFFVQGGDGRKRDGIAGLLENVDKWWEGVVEGDVFSQGSSELADGGVDLTGACKRLRAGEVGPVGIL